MKNLAIALIMFTATTACSKQGGAFVCTDDHGSYDAVARVSPFSGETQSYEAVDENGIAFTIDSHNSRGFECVDRIEAEKQQREREAEAKARCAATKDPWCP